MQEAKYSYNIKFNTGGFDCQFTARTDTTVEECLTLGFKAIQKLKVSGAQPARRWENGKNGVETKKAAAPVEPVEDLFPEEPKRSCPTCGKSDQLELIKWTKNGKPTEAWKCQRCKKWLPKNGD